MVALSTLAAAQPAVLAQEAEPSPPTGVHEHVAVNAPMLTPTRETSGTAWLPPATPMYGLHRPWLGWDVRLNGLLHGQVVFEPGDRHRTGGASTRQGAGLNWGMAMIRRNVGEGRLGFRTMLSAEPWTVPGCGALSFLATAEVCAGDTIHDRQQPHDMFMELAADYERPLRGEWRWQVYGGLAGEPALGPPGYPHRASAIANPLGPILHHWLDSTHIAFGVVTVGAHNGRWKAEGSVFHGREPDESRVDLDLGAFNSVAGRVSFLPTERLALQLSAGRLHDAKTDFLVASPDPAVRVTASAMYHAPIGTSGVWATTLAYGANRAREGLIPGEMKTTTSGALLESSLTWSERHTVFGRGEIGGVPAHHLHAEEFSASVFALGKVQVGYVRHLRTTKSFVPGIGGMAALSVLPAALAPRYSGRVAPTLGIFLSLQPARHQM